MDPGFRQVFNRHYDEALYGRMCGLMQERLAEPEFPFRLAETPLFLPDDLRRRCETTACEILEVLGRPGMVEACRAAIPARYDTPGMDRLPHFVAIDLAIVRGDHGDLMPRLIELQGFSSLHAMQVVQSAIWTECLASIPGMSGSWSSFFSGLTPESYLALLRRTILADEDPDEVILLDIDPPSQKTRPDYHATSMLLGVRSVCVSRIRKEGRRLLAPLGDRFVPVKRIYHRVVFDELEQVRPAMAFDYRDDLDVVWVCHPNWYWVWSKFALPRIDHPAVPATRYLSDVQTLPDNLSGHILKPLFSFAGRGVCIDVDREVVEAIPPAERSLWLLQEKVDYAPALLTPEGDGVKAEIRLMFLRPDDASRFTLAINLVRLSRGKMHGVDHNRGLTWVGGSVALWPARGGITPQTGS